MAGTDGTRVTDDTSLTGLTDGASATRAAGDRETSRTEEHTARVPATPEEHTAPVPATLVEGMDEAELRRVGKTFARRGVVVVPFMEAGSARRVGHQVVECVENACEFKEGTKPVVRRRAELYERHTLGGFGGVNLASGYHCQPARMLRHMYASFIRRLAPYLLDALAASTAEQHAHFTFSDTTGDVLMDGHPVYVQQLVDRLAARDPGSKVSGEQWHRDCGDATLAARAGPDGKQALRLGGWVALLQDQKYLCAPGTSLWRGVSGGFARLTKAEIAHMKSLEKRVDVPVGSAILFDETLAHRVASTSVSRAASQVKRPPMTRLFVACDICSNPDEASTWLTDLNAMRDGAVIPLKSGQLPPMYPALYWTNWMEKLLRYSSRLHAPCCERRSRTTHRRNGVKLATPITATHTVAKKLCPSLREQGQALPPYTAAELDAFRPTRVRAPQ